MRIACVSTVVGVSLMISAGINTALGYGPEGHHLVGAIADVKIAGNKSLAEKVNKLLDGLTLEQVAVLPDDIKDWDSDPKKQIAVLNNHAEIEKELRAFVEANPHGTSHGSGKWDHHDFHFTDVPVLDQSEYGSGTVGRSDHDLVHMISFCVDVLQGRQPETNNHKITKSVALILLAHYLGDIHQPLHVGAEYFGEDGKPSDPDKGVMSYGDEGGNLISGTLADESTFEKLHGYWDDKTVSAAEEAIASEMKATKPSRDAVAAWLAQHPPKNWKPDSVAELGQWPTMWANEILPFAREAHSRLEFSPATIHGTLAKCEAKEKHVASASAYGVWSGGVVRAELQLGGLRLAAIVEVALK